MAPYFDRNLDPILNPALTRRGFLRGATATLAAAVPLMTEPKLAWAASQTKKEDAAESSGRVLLDANENPLGPCQQALDAIAGLGVRSGRYDFPASVDLAKMIMDQEGLKEGYLALYPGASEPLHYAVLAFTSPQHGLVCANPTYEAPGMAAASVLSPVRYVPLRKEYKYDMNAMAAADPNAGCIYICNPNNPTGTTVMRQDIAWLLRHKPRRAVVVVDEAYIHYSDAETVLDYALDDRDVVVLRTFSEIYGLAGLRIGFAVGRPDLLARLQRYGLNPLPLPGVVAAQASLQVKDLVSTRKAANAQLRDATIDWIRKQGFGVVPSEANFFMVDVQRPGAEFTKEMEKKEVYVGRTWPIMPHHVRVTVGTADEMFLFAQAFAEVMGVAQPENGALG
ncbi:MAG TPA: pyridoxal phosphate-dependent aminotransferase [Acidobacteriaceae bacterium]|jgi:histidinol-phosphate aminotransferase|nr:pyridoxal phosphate-dependent aminotransferase [Acidobacteriaceae bacterium]